MVAMMTEAWGVLFSNLFSMFHCQKQTICCKEVGSTCSAVENCYSSTGIWNIGQYVCFLLSAAKCPSFSHADAYILMKLATCGSVTNVFPKRIYMWFANGWNRAFHSVVGCKRVFYPCCVTGAADPSDDADGNDDEADMMKLMGFSDFNSTKVFLIAFSLYFYLNF